MACRGLSDGRSVPPRHQRSTRRRCSRTSDPPRLARGGGRRPSCPRRARERTSLRFLVTGFCHSLRRLTGFHRRPRQDGVQLQRAVSLAERRATLLVRDVDVWRARLAPVRHYRPLDRPRAKLVPPGACGGTLMRGPEASVGVRWGRKVSERIRVSWLCSADLALHRDAGGGTRTPDTRIMIPLL